MSSSADNAMLVDAGMPDSPKSAKVLLCGRCENDIWGEMEAFPPNCCETDIICSICWGVILENRETCLNESCPNKGCHLEPGILYWKTDIAHDLPTAEREITRKMLLEADPRYKALQEDEKLLKEKIECQNEEMKHQTRVHNVLDEQVRNAADRMETQSLETKRIRELADATQKLAFEAIAKNNRLKATIERMRGELHEIQSRAGSGARLQE